MEKDNKVSFYGVILALSAINIFMAFEGSFSIQSIFPLMIIAIGIMMLHKEKNLKINKQNKILFILNVVYTISFFENMFRHELNIDCLIQLFYQIIIFIWFVIATKHNYNRKELRVYCNVVIVVFLICGLYVLYQNVFSKKIIFSINTVFGKKIGKNHFSAWISLAIILSFYYLIYNRKKTLYFIIFTLLTLSVIFMNSRGAILSAIICCGLIILNYIFTNGITLKKIAMILGIVLILVLGYGIVMKMMPTWLYNRYFVKSYVDYSNIDRIYRWKNAIDGIETQPILGYGPGIFSNVPEYKITEFGIEINSSTPAHNTYLDITLNGGIVALVIFIIFLSTIFTDYFRKYRLYIPIIAHIMINSMILGASKTVYFWNLLIFLTILKCYLNNEKEELNIFVDIDSKEENK